MTEQVETKGELRMSRIKEAESIIERYEARQAEGNSNPEAEAKAEAMAQASRAQIAIQEALEGSDLKAFQKAKADYNKARELIDFYENREDRFISESEYESLCTGIHAEVDAINEIATKKVMALLEEMKEIKSKLSEDLDRANTALYKLQYDVNEHRDLPAYEHGWSGKYGDKTLQDKDYSLLWFLMNVMERAGMQDCFQEFKK